MWKNNFAWKAFTLKHRDSIVVKNTNRTNVNDVKVGSCSLPSCIISSALLQCSGCKRYYYY